MEVGYSAIIVLGGGRPASERVPPVWVQSRARKAAELYMNQGQGEESRPYVLCLSGGSAHAPQLVNKKGLPVFESEATAAFIVDRLGLPPRQLLFETSSYDTIGNAYFARVAFTDIRGWRKLAVVTSEYHIERTRLIFGWVYSLPRLGHENVGKGNGKGNGHELEVSLEYFGTENDGLTSEEVEARTERENSSIENVKKLINSNRIQTLSDLNVWLTTEHKLYAVEHLSEKSSIDGLGSGTEAPLSAALLKSYGAGSGGGSGQ